MTNRGGEEEGIIINPDSSVGIYVTELVEDQCRLIPHNRKIKQEEEIKNIKVNSLKRAACINQCAKSLAKLVANLPNDMMASEDPSTSFVLQVPLYLSTKIIKESYHQFGGNMGELPDLKKQTVVAEIMQNWGERIWVMGSDTCVQ